MITKINYLKGRLSKRNPDVFCNAMYYFRGKLSKENHGLSKQNAMDKIRGKFLKETRGVFYD